MHWEFIGREPAAVQIHLATVVPAFFLGTWLIFFSKKGSSHHRALGAVYLSLMTVTAIAAIFVRSVNPGHFSWIHIFIPLTLNGVFNAVRKVRRKDIKGHRSAMLGLYFGGLVIAGALTFYPGRLMYRLFFG